MPFHYHACTFNISNTGLLLRPFPKDMAMIIRSDFKPCPHDPCLKSGSCSYAHNELELYEWNKEKRAMLYGMSCSNI